MSVSGSEDDEKEFHTRTVVYSMLPTRIANHD